MKATKGVLEIKTRINKTLLILLWGLIVLLGILLIRASVCADEFLDYPHCNTYDIACQSCHYMFEDFYTLGWPEWVTHTPMDIDDTPYNNLCWCCHNDVMAPFMDTHSSDTTSDQYGVWAIECKDCHSPHFQMQLREYGTDCYVDYGISTAITTTTLTLNGAGWTDDQFQGYILIPNLDPDYLSYNYRITFNDTNTLTIDGLMNQRTEDFERADFSTFPWSTGGDADWTIQGVTQHSGTYAAEAPLSLTDNQMSHLQVRLKLTESGDMRFWYKVSSEADDDYLRFLIDGVMHDQWSGDIDWTDANYIVNADWHTFRWEYSKGAAGSSGSDTAWLDDITFPTEVTATAGNDFAVIYGKLIYDSITTPNSGNRTARLFDRTGTRSYADGDSTYDGICEVCHTQTAHFRNNGTGPEPLHENIGGGQAGVNCISCHPHENGFAHGGGTGTGCGGAGCHGETGSHATHTISNTMGPDPPMDCEACHDPNNFPFFGTGGAPETLAETTVCDPCHSEGGVYNGVNDDPNTGSIGAKDNWDAVYDPNTGDLLAGKEKWCIGCHDSGTSVIEGVSAPDTELYYSNGHGRSGADKECLDCHVTTEAHIDGNSRSYAFDSAYYAASQSGVKYAESYRLRYVDGNVPLMIPANYSITFGYVASLIRDNAFRLCFDSGCHDSTKIFDDTPGDGLDTNFKATLPNPPRNYSYAWGSGAAINEHVSHTMNYMGPFSDSDWDLSTTGAGGTAGSGYDSLMACSSCHNVHGSVGIQGSTNEPMIRDGNLADRSGGYGFSYVVEDTGAGGYPWVTSTGATQSNSVGAIFRYNTEVNKMCGGSMCHGNPTPPAGSSYDASGSSWGSYLEYYRPHADY